ncbi:phage/plasmid primase, P4 family [Streptomyces resistomycificus]|uniref:phage/plasmid primase, P4 family n=1 Tax=Streptomyces resistomycificus TaxID=67356 RepID=UPI000691011F|nr:hypothetical protein AQJ84_39230 [Streptomyces resistomycificus]
MLETTTRDFHSRATSVALQQTETPRWHRFLHDAFGDDPEGREMIGFLHLLLGYSITGDVGAQVLPLLHGHGKNGKSVLLDVMIQILGDYADAAPPGFLMDRGAFSEHSTGLTELHGRRLIVCSELNLNDKFDEARVKLLTGGEKIKARRMGCAAWQSLQAGAGQVPLSYEDHRSPRAVPTCGRPRLREPTWPAPSWSMLT